MIDTSNLVPAGTQDQPVWVSGGSYVVGQQVVSPASYKVYVRKTIGGGATDPSADLTNWTVLGGRSTSSIVNSQSTSPCTATTATGGGNGNVKLALSGALTAATAKTMLNITGSAGEMAWLSLYAVDATARTVRVRVTVDGVVSPYAFDSITNSFSSANIGIIVVGNLTSTSISTISLNLRWNSSLLVEIYSSLTETDKLTLLYNYALEY